MDQAALRSLDDNNAFNAVGWRKLAEIIATSKKKRAEIEADADVAVLQTQLEAIKQRLSLSRRRRGADWPALEIEKLKAASDADTARARELSTGRRKTRASSASSRPASPRVQKAREIRKLEIEAQLSRGAKIDSSIAMATKHPRSRAQAQAELPAPR